MFDFKRAMRGLCLTPATQEDIIEKIDAALSQKHTNFSHMRKLTARLLTRIQKDTNQNEHARAENQQQESPFPFAGNNFSYQIPVLRTIAQKFYEAGLGQDAVELDLKLHDGMAPADEVNKNTVLKDAAWHSYCVADQNERFEATIKAYKRTTTEEAEAVSLTALWASIKSMGSPTERLEALEKAREWTIPDFGEPWKKKNDALKYTEEARKNERAFILGLKNEVLLVQEMDRRIQWNALPNEERAETVKTFVRRLMQFSSNEAAAAGLRALDWSDNFEIAGQTDVVQNARWKILQKMNATSRKVDLALDLRRDSKDPAEKERALREAFETAREMRVSSSRDDAVKAYLEIYTHTSSYGSKGGIDLNAAAEAANAAWENHDGLSSGSKFELAHTLYSIPETLARLSDLEENTERKASLPLSFTKEEADGLLWAAVSETGGSPKKCVEITETLLMHELSPDLRAREEGMLRTYVQQLPDEESHKFFCTMKNMVSDAPLDSFWIEQAVTDMYDRLRKTPLSKYGSPSQKEAMSWIKDHASLPLAQRMKDDRINDALPQQVKRANAFVKKHGGVALG